MKRSFTKCLTKPRVRYVRVCPLVPCRAARARREAGRRACPRRRPRRAPLLEPLRRHDAVRERRARPGAHDVAPGDDERHVAAAAAVERDAHLLGERGEARGARSSSASVSSGRVEVRRRDAGPADDALGSRVVADRPERLDQRRDACAARSPAGSAIETPTRARPWRGKRGSRGGRVVGQNEPNVRAGGEVRLQILSRLPEDDLRSRAGCRACVPKNQNVTRAGMSSAGWAAMAMSAHSSPHWVTRRTFSWRS